MRAAIFTAPQTLTIDAWATPVPGPGEVRVAVGATGICAGDMYIYRGKNPYAQYPIIGGHEIAGTVDMIGTGVTQFDVGARVVVEPFLSCGTCYPCRVGKGNCCTRLRIVGVHQPGGFAEHVVVPATSVHPMPAGLSLTLASFAEPVAIAVQVCRRGTITADDDVLIIGCGPIGLALIEVVQARGARVTATDHNAYRRDLAQELGAEVVPPDDALGPAILQRTAGEGMPVVIEATGNPRAMEAAVELVAPGGRVVIAGLVPRGASVSLPGLDFTRKEMTICGSRASIGCFPEALELLASGTLTYPRRATEFSLWEAPRVFADLDARTLVVHKAILVQV